MNRRSQVKEQETTTKIDPEKSNINSEKSNESEIKIKEEPKDQENSSQNETENLTNSSANSTEQETAQNVVSLRTDTKTTKTPQKYVQSSLENVETTNVPVASPKIIPKVERVTEDSLNESKTAEKPEISISNIKVEKTSPKSNVKTVTLSKSSPNSIRIVKVSSATVNQNPAFVKITQSSNLPKNVTKTIHISQKPQNQVPKISQIISKAPQFSQKPIQVQTSNLKVIQKPIQFQNQKTSQIVQKPSQKLPQCFQNSSFVNKKPQNSSLTLQTAKGPIKISSKIPQGYEISTETVQIKKEITDDEKAAIKAEIIEPSSKPIIIESFQSLQPIKQEKEENFDISLPAAGEDYGEIEVLDEYYDEVMNVSPTLLTEIKTEPDEEAKGQGRMNLRGVRLNLSEMLGKKERKYERAGKGEAKNGESFPKYAKITKSEEKPPKIIKRIERVKPKTIPFVDDDDTPSCFLPDRPYRCKKCPLSFKNRKDFSDHRRIHKKSDHQCDKCGQKFRFQASYLNHDCDFWCNICGKSISNKANLKIHLNYVHNIGSAKIFTCDLCGRFYKSKRNIDTHMKNHMSVTPFNCAICSKGFSHAGALKIHMWNHRDVVNCQFCHKKFKPRSLYYHIKKCPKNYEIYGNVSGVETIKEEFVTDEVVLEQEIKQPPNSKPVVVIRMKN